MGDNRSGNFGPAINHSWSRPVYEKIPSFPKPEPQPNREDKSNQCKVGLLSEEEMIEICGNGCSIHECKSSDCHARLISQSQLIKSNMEWIEWIENTIKLCNDQD